MKQGIDLKKFKKKITKEMNNLILNATEEQRTEASEWMMRKLSGNFLISELPPMGEIPNVGEAGETIIIDSQKIASAALEKCRDLCVEGVEESLGYLKMFRNNGGAENDNRTH